MRSKMIPLVALAALVMSFFFASSCGNGPGSVNCPVCGTNQNGSFGVIDIIPVPEHNPTGEPGGPFNSFDISWVDSVNHLDYVSDRIGLAVVVVDTTTNLAVRVIEGANGVAEAGDPASRCLATASGDAVTIPPLVSAVGNITRFGCRTLTFQIPGFGANGLFGGFPGAQCCAARANGVNPLSAPDGLELTPDGKTMFVANGSSTVVVFDLTSNPPVVIANVPTGQSPDWDGPNGVAPCIAAANGRAFADPTCGDLRADEMAFDAKDQILLVANGDPGLPFVSLIDMSHIINHTGTLAQQHCLPPNPAAPYGPNNFPTCILGQIYYDGAPENNLNVKVDDIGMNGTQGFVCPDPSNPGTPSGVSGHASAATGGVEVPCHHGPIIPGFGGAVSLAGIGGSVFNPNTGHFLVSNANATSDVTVGTIDEIDPRIGNPNGPVVIHSFQMISCMPTSVVMGPGNNALVGCGDHDGRTFNPNEIVIDGGTGDIIANIPFVGGVDEIWFNSGDGNYYVAARDMPNGPVLGIIDAKTNLWLQNVPTNSNSHSVSVDSSNNHIFVPSQAGGPCTTQSSNGCILVIARD